MNLLTVILVLVIVGVVLWAINKWIPMDSKIKTILNVAVVVIVIWWLLSISGLLASIGSITI